MVHDNDWRRHQRLHSLLSSLWLYTGGDWQQGGFRWFPTHMQLSATILHFSRLIKRVKSRFCPATPSHPDFLPHTAVSLFLSLAALIESEVD